MKLRNQNWIETEKYIVLTLREPYWGAWKQYGWEQGVEGLGISLEGILKARELNKRLRINVIKYGSYDISWKKALDYIDNKYIARDNKRLLVIPRNVFERIKTERTVKKMEEKEKERSTIIQNKLFN